MKTYHAQYSKVLTLIVIGFLMIFNLQFVIASGAKDSLSTFRYKQYEIAKIRAGHFYQDFAYNKGIKWYKKALKILPSDDTLKLNIANGFYQSHELDSANFWYKDVIQNEGIIASDIHYLNYAEILTSQARYMEAKSWFEKYQNRNPENKRVTERMNGLSEIFSFYKDSSRYEISNAPFNSDTYDFSPSYYQNEILFVSSRETNKAVQFLKPKYKMDQTYFLNLFRTDAENGVDVFNKRINSSYHEGPVSFYDNESKVIFTRNNFTKGEFTFQKKKVRVKGAKAEESKEGINKLKMFSSEKTENGHWTIPEELWFNADEYSTGHPTISADGQRLFFTSDMEGGLGQTDIYVSEMQNGAWGKPENMGNIINTEGQEMFPYVDQNNMLYFASNGHKGLGGLDIFKIDLNDPKSGPKNVGYPLNSSKDDFGITLKYKEDYISGYFSSNRDGGKGLDDIYEFKYRLTQTLPGQVIDINTGLPLAEAQVGISDLAYDHHETFQINTDKNGMFEYLYKLDDDYYLAATKQGYNRDTIRIIPVNMLGDTLQLHIMKNLMIKGTITDKISGDTLNAVRIIVTNERTKEKFGLETKEDGHYSFLADPNTTYSFKMKKHKFFTSTNKVNTGDPKNGVVIHDGELEELFVGKPIALNDIHYDMGKWDIRPDAAIELEKFKQQLLDNPSIIVELSTHTDSRGSDSFNLILSDKRAKSAAKYLLDRGISKERLVGRGYGETKHVNECKNGVECTEEQHQQNRRAEFMVTGFLPELETDEERNMLWIDAEYLAHSLSKESSIVLVSYDTRGTKLVEGVILDEHGLPIAMALITLIEGANLAVHLKSDVDGKFTVKVFPEKSYKIIAEQDGYSTEGEKFEGANRSELVKLILTKNN